MAVVTYNIYTNQYHNQLYRSIKKLDNNRITIKTPFQLRTFKKLANYRPTAYHYEDSIQARRLS